MEAFINLGLAVVPPAFAFFAGMLLYRKRRMLLLAVGILWGCYAVAIVAALVAVFSDPTYQTTVAESGFPILASFIITLAFAQAGISIGRRQQTYGGGAHWRRRHNPLARAPFQILVLPYKLAPASDAPLYAIVRRSGHSGGYWQGIAGGGEGEETFLDAARREAYEEARISPSSRFIRLDSVCSVPVEAVSGFRWGPHVPVIPEYSFGVELGPADADLVLSSEHTEHLWLPYEEAVAKLRWDSNKTALWELHYRLTHNVLERELETSNAGLGQ